MRLPRLCAAVLLFVAVGGSRPAFAERASSLLSLLGSPDAKVRKRALQDLAALDPKEVGDAEAEVLLRAATHRWPASDTEGGETALTLVRAAGARPGLVPVVGEVLPRLPGTAQPAALRLLAEVGSKGSEGSEEAVTAMVRLIRTYATTLDLDDSVFQPLMSKPQHGQLLFPALFTTLQRPRLTAAVASLALTYAQEEAVASEVLAAGTPRILRALDRLRAALDRLRPAAPTDDAWRWEGDHARVRYEAEYLVDLLGYCGPAAVPALEAVLGLDEPRLVYFAISSLLLLGQKVPADRVAFVAASPGVRGFLFQSLQRHKSVELMPGKYRTQPALAEGEMVRWLSHPSELGRPPHQIELVTEIEAKDEASEEPATLYLFRFRTLGSHWASKDGWMAGVAGGFPRSQQPTTASTGLTFSKFEPWTSRTVNGHIREITGLVRKVRRNQAPKK